MNSLPRYPEPYLVERAQAQAATAAEALASADARASDDAAAEIEAVRHKVLGFRV
jgi:hypothetical protein